MTQRKEDPWGYDSRRSMTGGSRRYYFDHEELEQRKLSVTPGMFMVFTSHDTVVPCGGSKEFPTQADPRILAGVLTIVDTNDFREAFCHVLLHKVYTKFFKGPFSYYRFGDYVSLGPDGCLIPDAGHRVGRILKAPTEDDPYLCVSAQTLG